jgi:predicted nuclease of predicted toxin-antitoxin system
MKFLIDAQLPESIAKYFAGHDVLHTSSLEKGNKTKDKAINKYTIDEDCVLITKDNLVA